MALSAFNGLLFGVVVSIGISAYFDSEIIAICVPSLIVSVMHSVVANRSGLLKTLSRFWPLRLLVFACCVTLATVLCTDDNWRLFGAPAYAPAPKALSMALNTLVSVTLTVPLFFTFELWAAKTANEFRSSEKLFAIPGFCSVYYVAAALPLVFIAHHLIHSGCFGFVGLTHTFMTKQALRVVIGLSAILLSSASVFLSMIVMRQYREPREASRS